VRAVRQGGVDPALDQARIDPVQDAMETAAPQARDEPAAGREAAIGRDEMTAARFLVQASAGLKPTGRPRPGPGEADGP
jgi:hypothetical protein